MDEGPGDGDALHFPVRQLPGRCLGAMGEAHPLQQSRHPFGAFPCRDAVELEREFHILGTVFGALIIAGGFNGLAIFGAPTFYQYVFQGAILIVAVGLSSLGRLYAAP